MTVTIRAPVAVKFKPTTWRIGPAVLPFCVFLLALVPRIAHIGRLPFWYDEVVSSQRASLPLPALLRDSLAHHHSPIYFLMIAPFVGAADPQIWLRVPSAIFSAFCVMLVGMIAAKGGGRGAGLAAALIMGLAPTQIAFAQEVRSYALVLFLVLLALYGLVGLVLAGERAALHWRVPGAPRGAWVCFMVGGALALCVLGDSLPWVLAANLTSTMLVARADDKRGMLRNFLIADAIVLVVPLPLYVAMLSVQLQSVANGLAWVPVTTPALVWYDIGSIYLMRVSDFTSFHFMAPLKWSSGLIGLFLPLAVALGVWRLRGRFVLLVTLLLGWLVLPVSFGIVSIWHPLLMPRYLLWSSGPFAILAGIGAAAAGRRLRPGGQLLALVLMAGIFIANLLSFYRVETKPRWDVAARMMLAQSRPSDVFYLFEAGAAPTMRNYLPKDLQLRLILDWSGDLAHAVQAQAHGQRVWAVYGDAWQTTTWQSKADFRASLAPLGTPSVVETAGARITFWRFDPAGHEVR